MSVGTKASELLPLKIKCTDTDCDNETHCFLQKKQKGRFKGGPCRTCGKDLVDFPRIGARNSSDLAYTFESLAREFIRHEFWERPFDQHAINHARRKGKLGMREAASKRIRQSVGRAKNPREGQQTPYDRNVLHYAQHAVAACCRKCIEYWHGIPSGRALTNDETEYLATLLRLYVDRRMPDLDDAPVKVPAIRPPKPVEVQDG
jgi:hypothetical protein